MLCCQVKPPVPEMGYIFEFLAKGVPQNHIASITSYHQGNWLFSTACWPSLITEGNIYIIHTEKLASGSTRSLTPALASVHGAGRYSMLAEEKRDP